MVTSTQGRRLRVLCTSTGGVGHIHALAPVALALRARGHHVHWAVAEDGSGTVAKLGFDWSTAGMTTSARRAAAATDLAAIMQLPMAHRRGPMFAAFFARAAGPLMQRDLAPVFERVQPDLVVREMAELAAAPMAAARNIPLVTVAFSGVLTETARRVVIDDLGPLWRSEGLDNPSWSDVYGQLYLHPFPASFGQRPDSAAVRQVRAGVPAAGDDPAGWLLDVSTERDCVYITSGTEPAATTFPWREVFSAVDAVGLDAVATIGPHVDPATLGTVPSGVRVERFIPQTALLERVTAVISHGGAGTVLGAAAHGRPQLVIPLFADQWDNAIAVRDAGCGVLVHPDRRSAADIEAALRVLLDGSSHRDAAELVAGEIAGMPPVSELIPEIESLDHADGRSLAPPDHPG
jgi:UDP:flavonoid glycosyltransferase YjiC (YdhE family)